MSTHTHPKGLTKAARKQLVKRQPDRYNFLQEFDFQKARHCHRIATISIGLAFWNGSRSKEDRQKDLADFLEAKAEYKACLFWIKATRLNHQPDSKHSIWRPIGGDSRRTEL